MDILMTMFKQRPSQSPVRTTPLKRPSDSANKPSKIAKTNNHVLKIEEPKFTFDQVKGMLEAMLAESEKNKRLLANNGLKSFDFNNVAAPGHSPEQCRALIDQLVKNTRRVRTLNEVLSEIKDNLERKSYTEIIQRATLDKDNLPKRPPSAYLLYHQDRFPALKKDNPLAAEVSKKVAKEWKDLPENKRRHYHKRHNDLMRKYEEAMSKLGLIDDIEPKRPGTARALFIQDRMESNDYDDYTKEDLTKMQKHFGEEYDNMAKDDKMYWVNLAKEKMEQYQQERVDFTASHPHLKPKLVTNQRNGSKGTNGGGGGRQRKPDMPQPPRSALRLYLERKMPEGVEGEEAEDLKRKLKDKFSQMAPKKQLKFIKKAVRDKERYDLEVEQFLEEHPEYAEQFKNKDSKPNLTKEQLKLYSSMVEFRPSLPSPTTYLYYCGKLLSDDNYAGIEPTQRMQFASESWKKLTEKERNKIEQEHHRSIENYISEMTDWLEKAGVDRRGQILIDEPRSNPDYWRKRLKSIKSKSHCKKEAE